ncbi:hypothetical protein EF405_17595 [Cyclobacteriaceae bacterium YHN15]|jgi:hypothetical protein|nr:hypothetical protein EF405_17595 [Cyclobacteriaceae bacterium YHN15]
MRVFIALILAIGISVNVEAYQTGEDPVASPVSIRKVDQNKVQLRYALNPEGPVTVKIYDENNTLVQKDRIVAKNPFAKYYDFSQVSPGSYSVEVVDANHLVEYLAVNIAAPATAPSPLVYSKLEKVENNSFRLLVNSLLPTDMSIMVFENDKLVYEENVDSVSGFQKLFKLYGISPTSKVEFFVKTNDGFSKLMATK